MNKLDFFRSVKVLAGLDDESIKTISDKSELKKFTKGKLILNEGNNSKGIYLIKKGSIEISKELNQAGDEARLSVLGEFDCVGEMSMFGINQRSANALTLTDVEAYYIEAVDFIKHCYTSPIIMVNLLNTLSERLSTTNNKMAEMVDSFVIKNRMFVLSQTLSRIMHDVRAPLTSIFISTQMMEEDLPEAKDYIRDISISSEKISNILEEIVEFVKGSSPELYFDKYKSSEIVENIELYFKLLTKFKKLHLHIDNDAPEYYYLDIVRFRRLMENLIRNSINALNPDGNLYIKLYGRENYIKVSISDDGPGLPEEKIPFMFEPFKSGYPAKGKGIGLAICKKIVDDHGGSIVYKTSPEGGAQFDIELPIIVTESTINS